MDIPKMPEIPIENATPVTVKVSKGALTGLGSDDFVVFKGVPYAKPPMGELRFAPPQEMEVWSEAIDCTQFKHCAVQEDSVLINTTPSEDCLYLNIWAPKDAKNASVFFWVHGGGFYNGCGSMPYYDGRHFNKDGVIVVTINYRLGALGFLALEASLKEFGTTGNWGTLDQIAALKWVNENIASFGGDPEKITIAGESAGSFSITNLIMSPLTKGLFSQAIMESGTLLSNQVAVPFTEAKLIPSIEMSRDYASFFGAEDTKEGLELLRSIDAEALWQMGFFSSDSTVTAPFAFWAVQDGYVIPKDSIKELKAGNYNAANYLIGYNRDEGAAFIMNELTQGVYEKYVYQTFKGERARQLLEKYKDVDMSLMDKARQMVTMSYFKAGMSFMEDIWSQHGHKVYAYEFDFVPGGNYPLSFMGAHHAAEIPFVFDNNELVGLKYERDGQDVQKEMHNMWVNFIKNGNPNVGMPLVSDVKWEPYHVNDPKLFYFNSEMSFKQREDTDLIHYFRDLLFE